MGLFTLACKMYNMVFLTYVPTCKLAHEFLSLFQVVNNFLQQLTVGRSYATAATFETKPFKLHKLSEGPSNRVSVTKEDALLYYRQMQTIRRLETSAGNLYKEKVIRGFCHLYSGQVSTYGVS